MGPPQLTDLIGLTGRTDLAGLAIDAANLMQERHGALMHASEHLELSFSRHAGMRRVTLQLVDRKSDRSLVFHADLPELDDSVALDLGLDFLDGVLGEFLEGNREAVPALDPSPYRFEEKTVMLSGGIHRPELEAAADTLLADDVTGGEEV